MSRHPAEILLVENNPQHSDLIVSILKKDANCNVTVVTNCIDALAYLRKEKPYPKTLWTDLIILSLDIPKKDGRALLTEIKTHMEWKPIPVIALASSISDAEVAKSYAIGANCYIVKPDNIEEFSSVIKSIKYFWFNLVTFLQNPASLQNNPPIPSIRKKDSVNVLLIEDNPQDVKRIQTILSNGTDDQFVTHHATHLQRAMEKILQNNIDVILLDLSLLETQGLDTFDRLFPHAYYIPIIALVTKENHDLIDEILKRGAQDYIEKSSVDPSSYSRIIRYAMERKQNEIDITKMTFYDPLTDLPNRSLFQDRLRNMVSQCQRDERGFGLVFLDLDHFKQINDTLGHTTGDKILKMVAQRLLSSVRNSDTLSRIGGDEFSIIVPNIDPITIEKIASKIHKSLMEPFLINDQEFFITISSGISMFPNDGTDAETLWKHSDLALFSAKKDGRNRYNIYRETHEKTGVQRFNILGDLSKAIQKQEFELHYQPRMTLSGDRISGAEALIRWNHPKRGMVPPMDFIPLAEEQGNIIEIGKWVLKNAASQINEWQKKNLLENFTISLNISSRQFRENSLKKSLTKLLQTTGLDPNRIELELTESQLFEDLKLLAQKIHELNDMGLKIVMDDFGAGYAGMGYMKELPLHAIKIDKSYIQKIKNRREEQKIVKGIIDLAHDIGFRVTAEGVEDQEQLDILRQFQCDEIQGYLISRPINAGLFTEKFLAAREL